MILEDLSELNINDLALLEAKYNREMDEWREDFIKTEHSPSAEEYYKNYLECKDIRKKLRNEIDKRREAFCVTI